MTDDLTYENQVFAECDQGWWPGIVRRLIMEKRELRAENARLSSELRVERQDNQNLTGVNGLLNAGYIQLQEENERLRNFTESVEDEAQKVVHYHREYKKGGQHVGYSPTMNYSQALRIVRWANEALIDQRAAP